ncbi:7tm Odorant receptor [Nesidiocoris tenuis]|uniref:Odorant receptor n=1 Tax=Nesidiocoris tenuis TaxID=355587 RepID=A0ABN7BB09_9HEMI|nr:7tm Odorant receptor [Nesidiocoris tenuis]
MGGICYWSNLYTLLYFSTVGSTIVLSTIFMVSNHLRGEKEAVLETVHFMFLALNSIAMVTDYNVNQQNYLQLYRAFDKGVFDYGDSLDEETIRNIEEIKSGARERKRKFGYVFSSLLKVIAVVHTLKKPLSRLVIGGKQPTNGADDLLWEAPIGVYMPFSDYWAPYIFGHLLSTGCGILIATTAVASTTTYQYISEELLAEYAIVRLTFERCVFRAEHLQKSMGKNCNFDNCLEQCANLSVKHHQHLLSLFSTFKKLVYMPLFMSVTDGGLMLCMSSYLTICGDISLELRLSMPGFVGSECLLMFIYCDYGEKLSKANADVGDGLYNAEKLSDHLNQLKPYLATVVRFTNVPKELSAGGFTAVNRQIFANIISAAYSYIGFMLST